MLESNDPKKKRISVSVLKKINRKLLFDRHIFPSLPTNLKKKLPHKEVLYIQRATKDLPAAKAKLQQYQNHITKDYNTLRIAEEKLCFLK
jgi:ribosomal protein L35